MFGKHSDNATKEKSDRIFVIGGYEQRKDVELDDIDFVEILLERWVLSDFEVGEEGTGIATFGIIGDNHIAGHALAETARAGEAEKIAACANEIVQFGDKQRLVDIDRIITILHKENVAGVEIDAHRGKYYN